MAVLNASNARRTLGLEAPKRRIAVTDLYLKPSKPSFITNLSQKNCDYPED